LKLLPIKCTLLARSADARVSPLNQWYIFPFNLNRFISGNLVDEHGAAAVAH
jgi:hypothetical protein